MQMCAARRDVCFDFQGKRKTGKRTRTRTRKAQRTKTSSSSCGHGNGRRMRLVWFGRLRVAGGRPGFRWLGGHRVLLAVATHERAAKRASREKSVDKNTAEAGRGSGGAGNRTTLGPKGKRKAAAALVGVSNERCGRAFSLLLRARRWEAPSPKWMVATPANGIIAGNSPAALETEARRTGGDDGNGDGSLLLLLSWLISHTKTQTHSSAAHRTLPHTPHTHTPTETEVESKLTPYCCGRGVLGVLVFWCPGVLALLCGHVDTDVGVGSERGCVWASTAVALHFHGAWQVSSGAWMFGYPLPGGIAGRLES